VSKFHYEDTISPDDIVSEDRLFDDFESRAHRCTVAWESSRVGHRHPACHDEPACRDEVVLSVRIEAGVLRAIRFDARGCVVSHAAAAMLCEYLEGRSLARINTFSVRDI
jgi:NifU-like protein involved in Fe-S cluster formation